MRTARRRRIVLLGALALALTVTAGLSAGAGAKKGGKSKTFEQSVQVNAPIPDEVAAGPSIPVTSQITIPKKFKKNVVGDVNVTVQTTGNAAGAANDTVAVLSSPSNRTVKLFDGIGDQSLGPLTLDDDTRTLLCDQAVPPCTDPNATLNRPFAGTAAGESGDYVDLHVFAGVKMRGAWTLTIWDEVTVGTTSVLNSWGLRVKPAKPVPE